MNYGVDKLRVKFYSAWVRDFENKIKEKSKTAGEPVEVTTLRLDMPEIGEEALSKLSELFKGKSKAESAALFDTFLDKMADESNK